ncbi:Crp/Fnr family transcriptional regulator [Pseudohoeflea coraliihabitans]|uniref:Crp/Fnr family transcriptional regulator n=1 Tax=Pseudohoeflea coraliihabitans TaxID=2860393 RepID=A0ABS6WMN4_9HYPH|nr:Crp/Fnr family transcriptional regulator [Pseudohoeflea sp. DP4N28-3]MBW3097211.1 Crp/Fnr family transcriptional regulator [Pseudohoeflea sp. DP4N28-3]
MSHIEQSLVRNRLLALLDVDDFHQLSPHLQPVELPQRFELARAGTTIDYAYFLDSGIGSIVAESPEGQRVEAGLFGFDGFAPVTLLLESENNGFDIFMQLPGHGYRIEASVFGQQLAALPRFEKLLRRYVQTLTTQTAFTALSNAVHHIDERLARWLLMCHDRVEGDEIAITHEFLSLMLAVRRPSVTTALHVLEGNLFIKNLRGTIIIRDRDMLEAFAADVYGKPEEEYRRLIGRYGKSKTWG